MKYRTPAASFCEAKRQGEDTSWGSGVYPMVPAGHALDEMILDMA